MKVPSYVTFGKEHFRRGSRAGIFKGLKVCPRGVENMKEWQEVELEGV